MINSPKHVAIVLDGNGRWAEQRGLSRLDGHKAGVQNVTEVVQYCEAAGIDYLTLYAFSSENWSRPKAEVNGLMSLLGKYLLDEGRKLIEKKIAFRTIGSLERLPRAIQKTIEVLKKKTEKFNKQHLILALSYGARDELVRAAKSIADEVKNDKLSIEQINEKLIEEHLYTRGIPDPDLFIRTSGEIRLSNFLLWQLSYTELYFTPIFWPDFNKEEFDKALAFFESRKRRFGLTADQISAN